MLKPLKRESKSFTYKSIGFTWFIEQYENHIDFKVLSNLDSEVIYHDEFRPNATLEYMSDDVFIELDNYVRHNITSLERLYGRIIDWGNQL